MGDIYNYVGKVVSADCLKRPEEFDYLVEQIQAEAKVDYPSEIVEKQKDYIQELISEQMAIFVADAIMSEKTFKDKGELFRYINLELPKRFYPLKSYIDFEVEKKTEDIKLRKKMQERRKDIMKPVVRFCFKKMEEK